MITEKHKSIYNCYLKHFRNGEPYKPRQDFSNLDEVVISDLNRMYNFFTKFDHINWDEFFGSPRALHSDEKCPPLKFFTTRAAIKSYNLYKQKQELQNPANQLDNIRKGMSFIGMFCIRHNIPVSKYLHYKDGGLMYAWVNHYREHRINPYCLMEMGDILSLIHEMEEDIIELYLKEFSENIGKMKLDYYRSSETKNFVTAATKKITEYVDKNLKK